LRALVAAGRKTLDHALDFGDEHEPHLAPSEVAQFRGRRIKRMPYGLFDLRSKPYVIGRIVTATITLVTVLIVYDGWATLKFFDVFRIVLGPIIAVVTSHVFSNSLVQQVDLGRRPTMSEWLAVVRFESRFLLLAIPPLAILSVLRLANVALTDAVQVLIWLEAISLTFWAGLAAWYAGLRGRALALSILGGVVVAAIVLLLQVFLQPGKALNDGVAASLPVTQWLAGS